MKINEILKGIVVCLVICIKVALIESAVYAKDLFVSTDGDDTFSHADNDIHHPWRTVEKAWYSALAGDTVYFRRGTYVIATRIDTKHRGDNGTAENPIRFMRYGQEEVVFTSDLIDDVLIVGTSCRRPSAVKET